MNKSPTRILIADCHEGTEYIAENESMCRDMVDLEAYRLAVHHGDCVQIGSVFATPYFNR